MAGTITNDGFYQILYYGFENYPISVRILDDSDNVIDIQTTTFTKSGSSVEFNDIVLNVTSEEAPVTISKITIFSDGETIWEYPVNYEFPAEGTLTFSLSMELSGSNTVTNDGAEYILFNGLRNENLVQTIIRNNGAPISETASFGDPVDNAISMTGDPVFSVPAGTTVTGMDTTLSGPSILLSEIRNLSYVYNESGTLTLSDYTITLTNAE